MRRVAPGCMIRMLHLVDRANAHVGCVFSWLIVLLTAIISFEVVARYAFRQPHAWVQDGQILLYGVLFLMAGAYTLSVSAHVRGDILYGFLRPRTQAALDLVLYLLFFFPGIFALTWAGYDFAAESLRILERSSTASDGPPAYPLKIAIPVAGSLLIIQGIAEVARCGICLARGEWPPRATDIEEVDVEKLKSTLASAQVVK